MIRRFIGHSELLISVIGIEAGAVLAAEDPQAVVDAASWAGVTWMDVPLTADLDAAAALAAACPGEMRLLVGAADALSWQARSAKTQPELLLGAHLVKPPVAWRDEDGLVLIDSDGTGINACGNADASQAACFTYNLFVDGPRELGLLEACYQNGIGAIARDPLAGLDACPGDVDPDQWQLAMARLDELAEAAETDRRGLTIGILQSTPGMSACLVAVANAEEATALADYGSPGKTKIITKTLRCIAAMRAGELQPPD